jgi:hypothetical protein
VQAAKSRPDILYAQRCGLHVSGGQVCRFTRASVFVPPSATHLACRAKTLEFALSGHRGQVAQVQPVLSGCELSRFLTDGQCKTLPALALAGSHSRYGFCDAQCRVAESERRAQGRHDIRTPSRLSYGKPLSRQSTIRSTRVSTRRLLVLPEGRVRAQCHPTVTGLVTTAPQMG